MEQLRCKNCGDYVDPGDSNCPYCGEPMNPFSRMAKMTREELHKDHIEHEGEHEHHRGHVFNQAETYEREPAQKSESTFDFSDLEKAFKKLTNSSGTSSDKKKKRGVFGTIFLVYIIINIIMSILRNITDF